MRFKKYINEEKKQTLKANIRKKVNKDLNNLVSPKNKTKYFDSIPLNDIMKILDKYDIIMLQEDNTEWSGMLTGNSATTAFDIAPKNSKKGKFYEPYTNANLLLQWHKMSSGRYEITVYVS